MNIPHIQISTIPVQIGIHTDPGSYSVETSPAQMNINQELPMISIEREASRLDIDQSAALGAYGFMSPIRMNSQILASIPEVVQQIVRKTAQDGDRMAAVHESNNVIAEVASEPRRTMTEFNYLYPAGLDNVRLEYHPEELNISLQEGTTVLDAQPQQPQFTFRRAEIQTYILQWPELTIEWPGRYVDQRI